MIRRQMVAVMAMLVIGLVAGTRAEAGGGAVGVKKTATVKIRNTCSEAAYVWIVPKGFAEPTTVAEAKRLGALLLPAKSGPKFYPVPAGEVKVYVAPADMVPMDGDLPPATDIHTYHIPKGGVVYAEVVCTVAASSKTAAVDGCVPSIRVVKKY